MGAAGGQDTAVVADSGTPKIFLASFHPGAHHDDSGNNNEDDETASMTVIDEPSLAPLRISSGARRRQHRGQFRTSMWWTLPLGLVALLVGGFSRKSRPASSDRSFVPEPVEPFSSSGSTKPVLPQISPNPSSPCHLDAACGYILEALDPALPPGTRDLLDYPGTCQNWSRDWLRTNKNVFHFSVNRIRQRYALAMLYCEWTGDEWLNNDLWISDLHECDWFPLEGIDPCGQVEDYRIFRNSGIQMRGKIPPELSMISSLWELDLSDNLLTGTIPSALAKLSDLNTLKLPLNRLKGPVPDIVWEFENMVHLDLGYNFFTGTIPNSVGLTSPRLQTLMINNNQIGGTIPETLGDLPLQRLHLNDDQFIGTIPPSLNTKDLKELRLENNKLTGDIPTESLVRGGDRHTKP